MRLPDGRLLLKFLLLLRCRRGWPYELALNRGGSVHSLGELGLSLLLDLPGHMGRHVGVAAMGWRLDLDGRPSS